MTTHHLRLVGPDERAPSWWQRLHVALRPARLAVASVLARVAALLSVESIHVAGFTAGGEVAARVVVIGRTAQAVQSTLLAAAAELVAPPVPEPAA